MEVLFSAILALLHWRLLLCVTGSVAITLMLSNFFVGFTAGYCITVVLLATGFGIYWQSRSEAGLGIATQVPEPEISRPVAFLGLSFFGLIWGGLVTELLKSALLAITSLILAVAVVSLWYGLILRRPIPPRTIVFSAIALLSGFLTVLFVAHLNA